MRQNEQVCQIKDKHDAGEHPFAAVKKLYKSCETGIDKGTQRLNTGNRKIIIINNSALFCYVLGNGKHVISIRSYRPVRKIGDFGVRYP